MNYSKNVVVKEYQEVSKYVLSLAFETRSLSFVSNIQYHERRLLNEYYKKTNA